MEEIGRWEGSTFKKLYRADQNKTPLNGRVPKFEPRKKRPTIWSFWKIFGPHGDIPSRFVPSLLHV